MSRRIFVTLVVVAGSLTAAKPGVPQSPSSADSILTTIREEATVRSQLYRLAQVLIDSIGPRLTGSPEQKSANDWALNVYRRWGIPARAEQYGTWNGWRRGTFHADLIAPRVRSLEGMLLSYSPGTDGPVEGEVAIFPALGSAAEYEAWLPQVRGKFIASYFAEPTCRPDESWQASASPGSFEAMQRERRAERDAWFAARRGWLRGVEQLRALQRAGALGFITPALRPGPWVEGWGVMALGRASGTGLPELSLSCEDYGLIVRLAENGQGPRLRVDASAELLGEVPVANVIAELRGTERPNEYVVLSAHLDSWDAGSGATDDGAATVVMMEAMRILKAVYPNPRRTIIAGHWNGEEQGLNGSRAFAADHPEVIARLQALFNLDNGTGRVDTVSMQGLSRAGDFFRRWLARVPGELRRDIALVDPGTPSGGTDHASFVCHGAPAFDLSSVAWDYGRYTWHTNLDTFDKLVFDDLRSNAMLIAMLAYLASEEPELMPREPRVTAVNAAGQAAAWPTCGAPTRSAPAVP